MPAYTSGDVASALNEVIQARARAIAALNLPDPEDPGRPFDPGALPAGADPAAIAALEAAVGPLPPSVRHFYAMHDGVPSLDMGSDIYSLARLLAMRSEAPALLSPILGEIDRTSADGLLIFGSSESRKNLFIFDTRKPDAFGEWPVIYYTDEDGLLDEYPDFVEFLKDMADTLRVTAGLYE
jgi:hypothetical protein